MGEGGKIHDGIGKEAKMVRAKNDFHDSGSGIGIGIPPDNAFGRLF